MYLTTLLASSSVALPSRIPVVNIDPFTPVSSLLVLPFNDTGYAIGIISMGSSDGIISFGQDLTGFDRI